MDAQTILWTDTDVYQRRYEKIATALMAVERALSARRPLAGGEDEFLSLYATVAAAAPENFTTIWADPFAYFWTRLAYELVGWCLNPAPPPSGLKKYCATLGTDVPREALALHLDEFKKFVIGLELFSGKSRRFSRPMVTKLPFAIPGTRFSVLGRGSISVIGFTDATPEVVYQGATSHLRLGVPISTPETPRLVERPIARHGDLELLLKPEVFCLPDISAAAALVELPDDYQAQQVPLLCDALALVERHQPLAFEHLREVVQVIAFKPPAAGDYSNVSFSDLPGAFIVSAVKNAYWMADALIHELLHNRLFFIIERNEILETGSTDEDEGEFYSPWRDDPRPLGGLLHAVYVYIGVCKFWLSVCESGETSGIRREYVEDQAVRAVLDLKVGISQLRRYGTFTEIGADLFKQMEREVDQLWTSARALKLSPSNPAAIARGDGEVVPFGFGKDGQRLSILETVLAHAEQNDTHRQVDLKSALNLS